MNIDYLDFWLEEMFLITPIRWLSKDDFSDITLKQLAEDVKKIKEVWKK